MPAPHITAEQLVQHQDWLFRMVRQLVRDDFTAEDMVQATMTEAIADETAGSTNLRGWLGSTARRLTAQHWRSNVRRGRREHAVGLEDEIVLQNSTELTEMFDIANRALSELPEKERVAVMMRHMQGLKPSQVALEMGVPVEQVYRHTENGTKKLRGRLETRYGRDWRSNCLAILALPSLKKTPVGLIPVITSVAVGAALLAGGFWALQESGPKPQSASADLASLSLFETTTGPEGMGSMEAAGPVRSNLPLPSGGSVETLCLVLGTDGAPYASAQVIAFWQNSRRVSMESITDHAGYVSFLIPADVQNLRLQFGGRGLFGHTVAVPSESREELQVLQLIEGEIPVSLKTGRLRAGETIVVKGGGDFQPRNEWFAMCDTDEAGIAHLQFPAPGRYHAAGLRADSSWLGSTFYVGVGGIQVPIPVAFEVPLPFTLVAQDAIRTTLLDQARFHLTREAGEDFRSWPLPSDRGRLPLAEELPLQPNEAVQVKADGYYDSFARIQGSVPEEVVLPLFPKEWVQASIHLADPNRIPVALTLYDSCPMIRIPDLVGGGELTYRSGIPYPLQVEPDGRFDLPRAVGLPGAGFRFTVTDDLGGIWESPNYLPRDREGNNLEFTCPPQPEGMISFAIPGGEPASSSVHYQVYRMEGTYPPNSPLVPDEAGRLHFPAMPEEFVRLDYWAPDMRMTFKAKLPEGMAAAHFERGIPDRNASLTGRFYGPDGQLVADGTTFNAVYLEPTPVSGPGSTEDALLVFYGAIEEGYATLEACPEGRYSIRLSFRGLTEKREVDTYEPFEFRFPANHVITARVVDSETGTPLDAALLDSSDIQPDGLPEHLLTADSGSGYCSQAFRTDFDRSHLLFAKWGYEPELVGHLLSDDLTTIRLKPGRSARADFEELGCTPVEGNTWICDAWGGLEDPRQPLVNVYKMTINNSYAPRDAFHFVEINGEGSGTGRRILVREDGSAELIQD